MVNKYETELNRVNKKYQIELDERGKDLDAEKEKKKNMNKFFKEQKQMIDDYAEKVKHQQNIIQLKTTELDNLRRIDNNEDVLLDQLSILEEKVNRLEK